jgi:hypothetical protein
MKMTDLLQQLKWFIEPHPNFIGSEEKIFTPQKGLRIKFWVEGGFEIEGLHNEIEINYNSIKNGLLILAVNTSGKERIIRLPVDRIIAFELLPQKDIDNGLNGLLRIGNEQKN